MSVVASLLAQGSDGPGRQLEELLSAPTLDAWDLVFATLTVVAAWLASRVLARATARVLRRVDGLSIDLRRLATRVVRSFVFLVGVGVALAILGAPIQPVLAATILVTVAAALALRGVAENFSAGLVLQTLQPVHVGDHAELLGFEGVVQDITSRSLVLDTYDGRRVHLPNRSVLDEPLVNGSIGGARRSVLEARWASDDAARDEAAVLAAVQDVDGVLGEPPPGIQIVAVDGRRLTAHVRLWHEPGDALSVRGRAVQRLADLLASVDADRAVACPPLRLPLPPSGRL